MATPREAVNAQVSRLVEVNVSLYAALAANPDASDDAKDRVVVWHQQALLWIDLGNGIADGSNPRRDEWSALGKRLAEQAKTLGEYLGDSTPTGKANAFLRGMPGALAAVANYSAGAVASALSFGAGLIPWPVWAVVGLVGAGAAAALVHHGRKTLSP
jgi:hypothetical protein